MLALQAAAGNRAVAGLLQREAAPAEGEPEPGALRSSLFHGDDYLRSVALGQALLARGVKEAGPVRLLQAGLIMAAPESYLGQTGMSGVDGDFGPKTEQAVKDFQARAAVGDDGVVGPVTLRLLDGAVATNPDDEPPSPADTEPPAPGIPDRRAGQLELAGFGKMDDLGGFGVSFEEVDAGEPPCADEAQLKREETMKSGLPTRGTASAHLHVTYAIVPATKIEKGKKGKAGKPVNVFRVEVKCIDVLADLEIDSSLPAIAELGPTLAKDAVFLRNREAVTKSKEVDDLDLMKTLPWTTVEATRFHENLHAASFHNTVRWKLEPGYRRKVAGIERREDEEGGQGRANAELALRQVTKEDLQIPWAGRERDDRTAWNAHWDIRLGQFFLLVKQYDNWRKSGG